MSTTTLSEYLLDRLTQMGVEVSRNLLSPHSVLNQTHSLCSVCPVILVCVRSFPSTPDSAHLTIVPQSS